MADKDKEVRLGQLIAPFGPGSIYTDRRGIPHVVGGLDHWHQKWDQNLGFVPADDVSEFQRSEERLSDLLGVPSFRLPPDHRVARRGGQSVPNAMLKIPAHRFPRWYRNTKTGSLRRFNLSTARLEPPGDGAKWQPVRFVAACSAGHLCDFPWKAWIHCTCVSDAHLVLTDSGGTELTSVWVSCNQCGKKRNLSNTTFIPEIGEDSAFQKDGIVCPGDRPWLGEGANEECSQPLVAVLINQTNLYFGRTVSAISIPTGNKLDRQSAEVRAQIEEDSNLGTAKFLWKTGQRELATVIVKDGLQRRGVDVPATTLKPILEALLGGTAFSDIDTEIASASPESDLQSFRRAEYNAVRVPMDDVAISPNLRIVKSTVPTELVGMLSRVNLVDRLREVRVFCGFDRLRQTGNGKFSSPDISLHQLFRHPPTEPLAKWLPAIEVFGEGLYIELEESRITRWQAERHEWIARRLPNDYISRLQSSEMCLPPLRPADLAWASRYLLVHTLAHILINQLVFDCGYSSASLRERLFVSADESAPMAGLLIYTSAGDSEGTLGGLVRLGQPELLGRVFQRALGRAFWCSADPVCSENLGGQGYLRANLAACHSCALLPETSCETINHGLDRAMIVGTPRDRTAGFMAELITQLVALD